MTQTTTDRPFIDWPIEKIETAITNLDDAIHVANRNEDWLAVVEIGKALGNLYAEKAARDDSRA